MSNSVKLAPNLAPHDLSFHRRRAKELLKLARAGEHAALARFVEHHPEHCSGLRGASAALALHDAQLVVAREQGFSSWPRLKAYTEALHQAPLQSREERLQSIIRAKDLDALGGVVDLDPEAVAYRVPPPGYTPLHIATSVGWEDGVRFLLDAGADINAISLEFGLTPLRMAIGYGLPPLAMLLLERGADPIIADGNGKTTLQVASYSGNREMIQALLDRGAPVDIFAAVTLRDEALVRSLHSTSAAVLEQRMCSHQNVTISPLQLAAFHNESGMVELLLTLGAVIDARDEQGRSAMDLALHSGKRDAYECLRAHGAAPDAVLLTLVGSAERSARIARLHQALVDGALGRAIAELDTDPTLINQRFPDVWGTGGTFGAAPLHWAAMFGHLHLARMLLDRGADLTLRDLTYNATPSGWANEYQRREMVAFLEAHTRK